jgi:low temperature requirement protein LtrA
MGVSVTRAFSIRGGAFVAGYVTATVAGPLLLVIALRRYKRQRRLEIRMLITYIVTAVLWIAGAVLVHKGWIRATLWVLALGTEYAAARTGWPVPGLGRSTTKKLDIAGGHLAERYQQFFLIALGEMILIAGAAYAGGTFGAGHTAAFAVALATSVLTWRIYFQRAGQILPEAVSMSHYPAMMGRSTADSHLIMLAGVVTTAIGYQLVIDTPYGRHSHIAWIAVILGGPALFTVGRARFEYEVFARVSPSRIVVLVVLVALAPALLHLPPLVALAAAAAVLAAAAVADAWRAWGRPPEAPSPPM